MMTSTLVTALFLCSFTWISGSASKSQTVKVQSGEDVKLLCPNISKHNSLTFWFRLVNRTEVSCISVMFDSNSPVRFCDGYQTGNFEMSSNISTLFLNINQVNVSDSGQYFCAFYMSGPLIFRVIYLNVDGDGEFDDAVDSESQKMSNVKLTLATVILGGLTVFLMMVIAGLLLKIRKLQKADDDKKDSQQSENLSSDDLNYATVTFASAAKRRELEPNVVYAATR
ncbi:uncharacterized protein LOC108896021 [Lates calcarifer]|uniref:Uncharacterized protein LOC108896021 n=1 Tax=Lates calcarifer TaxID=8187 RepID=A0AAJ7Q9Q6_LATCA|nr:uncharacterized protein LOC108896021 [Lates calcarifer]